VYHFSQKSLVLCDVQSMFSCSFLDSPTEILLSAMKARIKGEPKNVIFDPMAHTPKG
jgi:hypothetical protein